VRPTKHGKIPPDDGKILPDKTFSPIQRGDPAGRADEPLGMILD
jgi:hypothetical protein